MKYILFPNSSTSLQHIFKIVVDHSTQVQIHLTNSCVWYNTVNYIVHQILRICSSYTTETLLLFRSKPLSPVPEALTSTVAVFTCVIITNILHKTGLMRYLSFCVYLISFRTICEVFLFSGPVNDFFRRIVPLTTIFHTLDILILHMTFLFYFLRQSLIELSWPRV